MGYHSFMRSFVRSHRLIIPYSPLDLTLAHFLFCEIRVQIHTTTSMSSRSNLRFVFFAVLPRLSDFFVEHRINRMKESSESVTVAAHPSLWQHQRGE